MLIEAGAVFYAEPPYPCPSFRLRLSSIRSLQIEPGIEALSLIGNECTGTSAPRAAHVRRLDIGGFAVNTAAVNRLWSFAG